MVLVKTAEGERRVYVSRGMVVDALYPGASGFKALKALADLQEGSYEFVSGAEARHASILTQTFSFSSRARLIRLIWPW